MTLADLIQNLKQIPISEVRTETADRFECVLENNNLKSLIPKLDEFFGLPKKPAGTKASGEIADLASDFGGVLHNQTLYYTVKNGTTHLAMIWPWSDGTTSTVKIFKLNLTS